MHGEGRFGEMASEIRIRSVSAEKDADALLSVYAPYVRETAITFEYEVPTREDFLSRIRAVQQKYPYLAALKDGQIAGYAYAGAFNVRAAYDWSAETSIYVRKENRHEGIGGALYRALEQVMKGMHVTNLNACIGVPAGDTDPNLDLNSAQFHEHTGYSLVGRFHRCGYKFGRWYDMIWMEKFIGDHPDRPEPIVPASEVLKTMAGPDGFLVLR